VFLNIIRHDDFPVIFALLRIINGNTAKRVTAAPVITEDGRFENPLKAKRATVVVDNVKADVVVSKPSIDTSNFVTKSELASALAKLSSLIDEKNAKFQEEVTTPIMQTLNLLLQRMEEKNAESAKAVVNAVPEAKQSENHTKYENVKSKRPNKVNRDTNNLQSNAAKIRRVIYNRSKSSKGYTTHYYSNQCIKPYNDVDLVSAGATTSSRDVAGVVLQTTVH